MCKAQIQIPPLPNQILPFPGIPCGESPSPPYLPRTLTKSLMAVPVPHQYSPPPVLLQPLANPRSLTPSAQLTPQSPKRTLITSSHLQTSRSQPHHVLLPAIGNRRVEVLGTQSGPTTSKIHHLLCSTHQSRYLRGGQLHRNPNERSYGERAVQNNHLNPSRALQAWVTESQNPT